MCTLKCRCCAESHTACRTSKKAKKRFREIEQEIECAEVGRRRGKRRHLGSSKGFAAISGNRQKTKVDVLRQKDEKCVMKQHKGLEHKQSAGQCLGIETIKQRISNRKEKRRSQHNVETLNKEHTEERVRPLCVCA